MGLKTRTVRVEKQITDSLSCDACGEDIPMVFEDVKEQTYQGQNALRIKFDGGYGMYIDPLVQGAPWFTFCEKCANDLCARWKCFAPFSMNNPEPPPT